MEGRPRLLAPAIGTAVFAIAVPGTVIVWVPYALSNGWSVRTPFLGIGLTRWFGAGLALVAFPVFADFLIRFVREGRGTPAPIAPPPRLVVGGPFRYCRNPGYVGVVSLVVGQGLFLGSGAVLIYAVCLGLLFHLFVIFYEERDLRRRFGEEYEEYCRRVPRWLPRKP